MSKIGDILNPSESVVCESEPPIDKEPLTPVEYVKHWINVYGDFKDGKIEKARQMTRGDLTKEDAEFLLAHGISKLKIAEQYGIPKGSKTYVLQQLGIKESLSKEEFKERMRADLKTDKTLAEKEIQDLDIIWFDKPCSFSRVSTDPQIRITKNCINLNAAFMCKFGAKYVRIGIVKDGRIVIAEDGEEALKLRNQSNNKSGIARILCNAQFIKTLASMGATLPIVYKMEPTASGMWIGTSEQKFR